ncbi:MAG: hypothetical protein COB23_09160 [Methylophaga sp.]|nr:MAG: hypothetical protein COB23_09160 [Methylophaga sp.]
MKPQYYTQQFILSLCLLLLSFQSHAEQWYHVELIVFEQLDTITDEQWPPMGAQQAAALLPTMATSQIQPASIASLTHTVGRLNRSARYRVHYHQAWQQPMFSKRRAKAVDIHSEDNLIAGSIRLYKSTYLHAELDLWLQENTGLINSWSDTSPDGIDIDLPRNPNLVESRRVRSKKIYFFDHPKMGAILQLTPVSTPIAVQDELESLETFSLPNEATPTVTE